MSPDTSVRFVPSMQGAECAQSAQWAHRTTAADRDPSAPPCPRRPLAGPRAAAAAPQQIESGALVPGEGRHRSSPSQGWVVAQHPSSSPGCTPRRWGVEFFLSQSCGGEGCSISPLLALGRWFSPGWSQRGPSGTGRQQPVLPSLLRGTCVLLCAWPSAGTLGAWSFLCISGTEVCVAAPDAAIWI